MAMSPSSRRGISRLEATFRPPGIDRRAQADTHVDTGHVALLSILVGTDPEPALDHLTSLVRQLLDVPVAVLSAAHDGREVYRSWSGLPEPLAQRRAVPLVESLTRTVLTDGARHLIERDAGHGSALAQTFDWHAFAAVPLVPGAQFGALWVADTVARDWSVDDVRHLESFAAYAVTLLEAAAERRRAEAALRDRQARYDALTASIPHGVWCVAFDPPIPTSLAPADLVDRMFERGRLVECNDALARALGSEFAEDMLGVSFADLIDRSDVSVRDALVRFVHDGFRLDSLTSSARGVHGQRRHYGTLAGVVEEARLVRVWGVSPQGGPRLESSAPAAPAKSLEALGRLANGVAHEFNNLITTIRGRTELALRERENDDDLVEIRRATERASALSRQLLSFGRRLPSRPTLAHPSRLVADIETVLQHVAGADAEVLTRCAADTGYVHADISEIERAMIHIVSFARDAAPEPGRFVVSTRNVTRRTSSGATPAAWVAFGVSHATLELASETLSRIAEAEFGALTLGGAESLVAAFALVRQNGGDLAVESDTGSGTMFELLLPRVTAPRPTESPPEPTSPSGGETVLIVEDEDGVRAVARRTLLLHGYTVMEAENADVALDVASAYPGHIHLLLTDVVMSGPNGQELADRLRSLRPDTRVVFMSGYTGEILPAGSFLEKPFTPSALASAVREALDAG